MRLPVAALVATSVLVCGCTQPLTRMSEVAYRHAVSAGATDLVASHGYTLVGSLHCQVSSPDDWHSVTVDCTGITTADEPVQVSGQIGHAASRRPAERYELTVNGHEVATATRLHARP